MKRLCINSQNCENLGKISFLLVPGYENRPKCGRMQQRTLFPLISKFSFSFEGNLDVELVTLNCLAIIINVSLNDSIKILEGFFFSKCSRRFCQLTHEKSSFLFPYPDQCTPLASYWDRKLAILTLFAPYRTSSWSLSSFLSFSPGFSLPTDQSSQMSWAPSPSYELTSLIQPVKKWDGGSETS